MDSDTESSDAGSDDAGSFDDAADELYALAPEEFTAARTAREKDAKKAGDRELATRIHALARPNVAGWMLNRLVRERPQEVQPFLELGEDLREASAAGEGDRLRSLGRLQRQTVTALLDDALAIAAAAGRTVSADVRRTLTETLRAALADADAAGELQAGRLTAGLYNSGLGGTPTITPPSDAPSSEKPPSKRTPSDKKAADPKAADTASAENTADKRRAQELLAAAKTLLEEVRAADDAAQRTVEAATAEVGRLRDELEVASAAAVRAERDRSRTTAELDRAERAMPVAERRAARSGH